MFTKPKIKKETKVILSSDLIDPYKLQNHYFFIEKNIESDYKVVFVFLFNYK